MEFEVTLIPSDYRAYSAFAQRLATSGGAKPRNRVWGWVIGFLLGLAGGAVIAVLVALVPWLDLGSLMIGAGMALIVLALVAHRLQRRMMPKEGSAVLGRKTVVLSDEWVRVDAELGTSYIRWSYIRGVYEMPEHVYLIIEPINGVILPRREFENPETLTAIVEYVKQRIPAPAAARVG